MRLAASLIISEGYQAIPDRRKWNGCPLPIHSYDAQRSKTFRIAKVPLDGEKNGERPLLAFPLHPALTAYGLASYEY